MEHSPCAPNSPSAEADEILSVVQSVMNWGALLHINFLRKLCNMWQQEKKCPGQPVYLSISGLIFM